jgi:hypothetical protein
LIFELKLVTAQANITLLILILGNSTLFISWYSIYRKLQKIVKMMLFQFFFLVGFLLVSGTLQNTQRTTHTFYISFLYKMFPCFTIFHTYDFLTNIIAPSLFFLINYCGNCDIWLWLRNGYWRRSILGWWFKLCVICCAAFRVSFTCDCIICPKDSCGFICLTWFSNFRGWIKTAMQIGYISTLWQFRSNGIL